jgi:hypothetical protein
MDFETHEKFVYLKLQKLYSSPVLIKLSLEQSIQAFVLELNRHGFADSDWFFLAQDADVFTDAEFAYMLENWKSIESKFARNERGVISNATTNRIISRAKKCVAAGLRSDQIVLNSSSAQFNRDFKYELRKLESIAESERLDRPQRHPGTVQPRMPTIDVDEVDNPEINIIHQTESISAEQAGSIGRGKESRGAEENRILEQEEREGIPDSGDDVQESTTPKVCDYSWKVRDDVLFEMFAKYLAAEHDRFTYGVGVRIQDQQHSKAYDPRLLWQTDSNYRADNVESDVFAIYREQAALSLSQDPIFKDYGPSHMLLLEGATTHGFNLIIFSEAAEEKCEIFRFSVSTTYAAFTIGSKIQRIYPEAGDLEGLLPGFNIQCPTSLTPGRRLPKPIKYTRVRNMYTTVEIGHDMTAPPPGFEGSLPELPKNSLLFRYNDLETGHTEESYKLMNAEAAAATPGRWKQRDEGMHPIGCNRSSAIPNLERLKAMPEKSIGAFAFLTTTHYRDGVPEDGLWIGTHIQLRTTETHGYTISCQFDLVNGELKPVMFCFAPILESSCPDYAVPKLYIKVVNGKLAFHDALSWLDYGCFSQHLYEELILFLHSDEYVKDVTEIRDRLYTGYFVELAKQTNHCAIDLFQRCKELRIVDRVLMIPRAMVAKITPKIYSSLHIFQIDRADIFSNEALTIGTRRGLSAYTWGKTRKYFGTNDRPKDLHGYTNAYTYLCKHNGLSGIKNNYVHLSCGEILMPGQDGASIHECTKDLVYWKSSYMSRLNQFFDPRRCACGMISYTPHMISLHH